MSEPTHVEDRAQSRGPSTNAPAPSNGESARPGGLRSKLRAATYDEGEQMLQPEAPVQLKPDPVGKGPPKPKPKGEVDALKGKVGALEEENAGLKDEVSGLRTENAERKRETDEVNAKVEAANAALVKGWEQDVARGIEDVHAQLRDADAAMGGFEALVERTLVSDDQLRAGDKAVDGAIETHKEAQKPGVLDGLSMILDVANLLKAGISLIKTVRKPVADGGGKAAILGAAIDLVTNANGTAKDAVDRAGKEDAAAGGDTTVAMVAAVDAKVDVVAGSVQSLLAYAFGKEKHAVFSALDGAARARNKVQDGVDNLGSDLSAKLKGQVSQAGEALFTSGRDMGRRVSKLEKLLAARDPAKGGGGELAAGTTGRSVFDLVAEKHKACSLFAETTLRVRVRDEDDFDTSIERTGYWLSVADPDLRRDLAVPLFPHLIPPSSRPAGVGKDAWYLPIEIGQPLSTLITDTTELPYIDVHLTGIVVKEHTTRAAWEDPKLRRSLLGPPRFDSQMDR